MSAPARYADSGVETVLDGIERRAEMEPDSIAVRFGDIRLTRASLDATANGIAWRLSEEYGVGADKPVAILMERGHQVIAAMLGVMKSGGCFVPIDPTYPSDRIRMILGDSQCRAVLTSRHPAHGSYAGTEEVPLCFVEDIRPTAQRPERQLSPRDLVYIFYTSGSTGAPKGVLMEHRSISNLIESLEPILYAEGGDCVREALSASFVFDAAAQQVFSCLANGATLFVTSSDVSRDPAAFIDFLNEHEITHCNVVSPLLATLIDVGLAERMPLSLRRIVTGGEAAPLAGIRRFFENPRANGVVITNMYGPTENCVDSTYFDVTAAFDMRQTSIPIGKPVPGTEVLVLDPQMRCATEGALGEICVAGKGLARGYLNDAGLTAQRFVPHPFRADERMYRTGDWGRWRPDGYLEFHGRQDHQVKIRGYRVELDEIGTHLEHVAGVRRAVAVAGGDSSADVMLTAFYESAAPLDPEALRAALAKRLPQWMLPFDFVWRHSLPLTTNGKIDRLALREVSVVQHRTAPLGSPSDDLERELAREFGSVLGQDEIGVADNFFRLGGHSLKAAQLLARIWQRFGVRVAFREFMEQPTVLGLARHLRQATPESSPTMKAEDRANYELSHAQKRIWLLNHLEGGDSAYNIPMIFGVDGEVDVERLNHAFRMLIQRHESLRTSFRLVEFEPRQFIEPSLEFSVDVVDLRGFANPEAKTQSLAEEDAALPFVLDRAPLMRASVVRISEERSILLLALHHIIADGWSLTVLFRELSALYDAGEEISLPPLRVRYRDYSQWHNARNFERERKYWIEQMRDVPTHLNLPYDFRAEVGGRFEGASAEMVVPHDVSQMLRGVAIQRQTTLSLVMLAVYQIFLYRLTKQTDFCVGLGVANRTHSDLEQVIGFFVNLVAIRAVFSEDPSLEETLDGVIRTAYGAFDHQDYPVDLLIRDLAVERRGVSQPLFNVVYAFQNFSDLNLADAPAPIARPILHPSRLERHAFETSKFDLTLFVWDMGTEVRWMLEYDTRLFRRATILRYLDFLTNVARAVGGSIW